MTAVTVEQQFLQFWSNNAARVALWADSSYDPLEESDILKLAKEMNFPLVHFHSSFGGGLTLNNGGCNHAWNPKAKPEDVVIIEMGYNDESTTPIKDAIQKMRKQEWYRALADSASLVKFVIFVHQFTYKQVCPPKPKKKKKSSSGWVKGAKVEGSKWTKEAMELCQELGIPAICLKGDSPEEMFASMLTTDAEGNVWQNEAVCRSYTSNGKDYSADDQLALWEDSFHSTAAGAEVHFRCVVKALQTRCLQGGFTDPRLANQIVASVHPASSAQGICANQEVTQSPSALWQQQAPSVHLAFPMQGICANQEVTQSPSALWQQQAPNVHPAFPVQGICANQVVTQSPSALWQQQAPNGQPAFAQGDWQSQQAWNWLQALSLGKGQARSAPY